MPPDVTLRPVASGDADFLFALYASTREEELAPLDWDDARKDAFLHMQFAAQQRFYHERFAVADFQIILIDGQRAGRLYVDRRDDEICIVDISLMPAYRGTGVGGSLLSDLLAEAERAGKPVRIHVERFNRALRLYERLGFVRIGDNGVYCLMEWRPERTAT